MAERITIPIEADEEALRIFYSSLVEVIAKLEERIVELEGEEL